MGFSGVVGACSITVSLTLLVPLCWPSALEVRVADGGVVLSLTKYLLLHR